MRKKIEHAYAAEAYRLNQRTMLGDTECEIVQRKKFLGVF
jgi:hypothetical protein